MTIMKKKYQWILYQQMRQRKKNEKILIHFYDEVIVINDNKYINEKEKLYN